MKSIPNANLFISFCNNLLARYRYRPVNIYEMQNIQLTLECVKGAVVYTQTININLAKCDEMIFGCLFPCHLKTFDETDR